MDNTVRTEDPADLRAQLAECLGDLSVPNVERALALLDKFGHLFEAAPTPEDLARQAKCLLELGQPLANFQAGDCLRILRDTLQEHERQSQHNVLDNDHLLIALRPKRGSIYSSSCDSFVYGHQGKFSVVKYDAASGEVSERAVNLEQSPPPIEPGPLTLDEAGARSVLAYARRLVGRVQQQITEPKTDAAVLSPDGSCLAVAHTIADEHGAPISLFEVFDREGARLGRWPFEGEIRQIAFAPQQGRVIVATEAKSLLGLAGSCTWLEVRNLRHADADGAARCEYRYKVGENRWLQELAVAPNGLQLAVLCLESAGGAARPRVRAAGLPFQIGHGQIIDMSATPLLFEGDLMQLLQIEGLGFFPGGKSLYLTGPNRAVIEITPGQPQKFGAYGRFARLPFDEAAKFSVCVSPDGAKLACRSDTEVSLYAVEGPDQVRRLGRTWLEKDCAAARFDPSGQRLIIQGSAEFRIYRLD